MCTAATYKTNDFYFGRTLDYEFSYGDEVTITPRNYRFDFRHMGILESHYAIIGMAYVAGGYPLYYDGINEKGLGMAGLNFVGNAKFQPIEEGRDNIAQFEFIPWILGRCQSVKEARELIGRMNLVSTPFSEQLPSAQLHWIISDSEESITVEPLAEGLKVYDNPVGVLTNNPPFPQQMFMLNNYMNLSPRQPENKFASELDLTTYSRGMGGMGLPGDLSSSSRFVKVAFTKLNAAIEKTEEESVSQFFHILKSVEQQKGLCDVGNEEYEYTIYSSCCNMDKGIYYYTTYYNSQVTAINMHKEDLNSDKLSIFSLVNSEKINYIN